MDNNLDIIIITYNRSEQLEKTLLQFLRSPFVENRVVVIDNASTDTTPEVCQRFANRFPRFEVVRNRLNIGGDANFLRAVEASRATYTWVVCDDDTWDFSCAGQVLACIDNEQADAIMVGPVHPDGFETDQILGARALVEKGFWFHFSLSFFPAMIFKTRLFTSKSMIGGYRRIVDHYPNFAFIHHLFLSDVQVYLPSDNLVIRNENDISVLSPLEWYSSWVNCCWSIGEGKVRKQAVEHATKKRGFVKCLMFWIALEKHIDPEHFGKKIGLLWLRLSLQRKFIFPLFLPVLLIKWPLNWLIAARQFIYKLMQVPDAQIPPVMVVDRDD